MKRTRNMLAARAERRNAEWRRKHAALFHDETAAQLQRSLAAAKNANAKKRKSVD